MTNSTLHIVKSPSDYQKIISDPSKPLCILNFWATWAQPCIQMNEVFEELAKKYSREISFLQIDAEEVSDVSEQYDIAAVPTFIFLQAQKPVDRLDGANAFELQKRVEKYAKQESLSIHSLNAVKPAAISATNAPAEMNMDAKLKALTTQAHVVLFMKGSPDAPECGFSRTLVGLLNERGIKFSHFDILKDEAVRQALKKYADWPTYPQLWVDGELMGGLDIVKEMDVNGDLQGIIDAQTTKSQSLDDRLKSLINQSKIMVFIKGNPSEPKCGFSRTLVTMLDDMDMEYGHFDILGDDEVRQGLKVYSDWPTYPQVYVKGELIGGLDIVKEMVESGDFHAAIQ